jgi:CAAX protease family protein
VRRHPVLAYFILACAISWLAVSPLILHYHVPTAWHAFGAVGPLAAALIITAVLGGRGALREFAAGMIRWRVGKIVWFLALSPIALCTVAIAALAAIGAPLNGIASLRVAFADREWLAGMFLASLAYGIGEEPGWRGFALPRLMRGRTAFRAHGAPQCGVGDLARALLPLSLSPRQRGRVHRILSRSVRGCGMAHLPL